MFNQLRDWIAQLETLSGYSWEFANQHYQRTAARLYGTVQPLSALRTAETEYLALGYVDDAAITAVSLLDNQVTLAGDYTDRLFAQSSLQVTASTGNDGFYRATAVELAGGNTVVTLDVALVSAVADGIVDFGYQPQRHQLQLSIRLQVYGTAGDNSRLLDPFQSLSALVDQLLSQSSGDDALVVRDASAVNNLPTPLDNQTIEPRAQCDLVLGITVDTNVGTDILDAACAVLTTEDALGDTRQFTATLGA